MDTILVKKNQVFITHNKSYTFPNDTILILPSSVNYEIKLSKSEVFFYNLAQRADKSLFTRELHNIIIANHTNSTITDSVKTNSSALPYVFYAGRPIRNIQIKLLPVFGPTVDDTSRMAKTWIEKTGNKLHFSTKEYIIRNNLIFKEGDFVDPVALADNERILRKLPYIEDARIYINPLSSLNDSTDILIVVKDLWATAFNIKVENIYSGRFEMWDRNILGFGHEIQSNIPWNSHKNPKFGTENTYVINNFSRSFITGKLYYNNSFHTVTSGIDLERGFFTPNVKYAGGLAFFNTKTQSNLAFDTSKIEYPFKYNNFDFWAGRSFLLNRNGFVKMRHNLTLTSRVTRTHFTERPEISATSYYDYQSKTLFLGAVSYSRHTYFKSNFIYSFGRTEDIPVGSKVELIFGKEFNEFSSRSYLASQLSIGSFIWNLGYFYTSLNIGSFLLNSWKPNQGVIDGRFNYFSPLIILKNFKFRQFLNVGYTEGFNRYTREYLTINDKNGILGFLNDSVYGTKRFNIHWETVCFTPWSYYDFRFVLFAYANHSWLTNKQEKLFSNLPYTSLGIGIRIRNERLVFNTIEISFSVYPKIPSGSRTKPVEVSGEPLLNPPNFLPQAPTIISYK